MTLAEAFRADLRGSPPCRISHLHRNDPGRNRNNRIARNHYQRREYLSQRRLRRNIPVAYGCHRNDRPVHTEGDAAEPVLGTLNNVHHRAYNNDQRENGEKEDSDLPAACNKRPSQYRRLAHHMSKLKYPEHPEQPEYPYHQEILAAGNNKAEVSRKDSQHVNHAVEAEDIAQGAARTEDTESVLNREQDSKEPLEVIEDQSVRNTQLRDTLKKNHEHAEQDSPQQHNIEPLPGRRLRLKNNLIKLRPEAAAPRRTAGIICIHRN